MNIDWYLLPYILLSYFIGSISGSILLGKIWKIDIRRLGSGNAGGTNAFRTVGFIFAALTVLIDISKGILAVYLVKDLGEISIIFLCVLSVTIGHVYPIFHNFKGGKGAVTLLGGLSIVYPESIIYVLMTWIISLILTGYVGLSTILAAFSLLFYSIFLFGDLHFIIFSGTIVLLILLTHRDNIKRMRAGDENQFKKIMLFRRK